jgi:hypothetical protein
MSNKGTSATKKRGATPVSKEDAELAALKKELKGLEKEADFDYPEEQTVESLTELLKEVKSALEADEEVGEEDSEEDAEDEPEADEDTDDKSEDEDSEEEEEDDDADPEEPRPTNLDNDDLDRINEETPDITGEAVDIIENTQYIRTYSKVQHGKDFKAQAEGFVAKRDAQNKEKDNGKKCKLVDSSTVDHVYVQFRREVGRGDNRKVEAQRVEFSLKRDGKKFKAMALALALKVANTPGQDGPGVVVVQ